MDQALNLQIFGDNLWQADAADILSERESREDTDLF
jgi:hypothetical protein